MKTLFGTIEYTVIAEKDITESENRKWINGNRYSVIEQGNSFTLTDEAGTRIYYGLDVKEFVLQNFIILN